MCANDEQRIRELEDEIEYLKQDNEELRAANARGCSVDDLAKKLAEHLMDTMLPQYIVQTYPQHQSPNHYTYYPTTTTSGTISTTHQDDYTISSAISTYNNPLNNTATGVSMMQQYEDKSLKMRELRKYIQEHPELVDEKALREMRRDDYKYVTGRK